MNKKPFITPKKLLLLLAIFFLLRVIHSYFFGWKQLLGDALAYNDYALAILKNSDWITNPDFHGHYRPCGYPIFLALIYYFFGVQNFFAVYIVQAILNALTVYYIFKLSASIFTKYQSYLALFWAGLDFYYIWYTGMILRETLVQFLIVYSFFYLWRFFDMERDDYLYKNTYLWKFIVSFVILFHTDAKYLFYIPCFLFLFLIYQPKLHAVKQYAFVLVAFCLLLTPWTVRNYIAYDKLVLVDIRTLDLFTPLVLKSLKIPVADLKEKDLPKVTKLRDRRISEGDIRSYPSEEERQLVKRGLNPNNRPPEELEIIKKNIYPASNFIERTLYKAKQMWIPFRFWSDYDWQYVTFSGPWSLKHNIISIIFYGMLIPFVFFAVFYLFKIRHRALWFLLFPIVTHGVLHLLSQASLDRHRIQIEAFIIILGCFGITILYTGAKSRLEKYKFAKKQTFTHRPLP